MHREKAWKVLWHCQFVSILTFIRSPELRHHPYLRASQDKPGMVVELKNQFMAPSVSVQQYLLCGLSWFNMTALFSLFALQLPSSVCSDSFLWGPLFCGFPWTPVSTRGLEAGIWVLLMPACVMNSLAVGLGFPGIGNHRHTSPRHHVFARVGGIWSWD